ARSRWRRSAANGAGCRASRGSSIAPRDAAAQRKTLVIGGRKEQTLAGAQPGEDLDPLVADEAEPNADVGDATGARHGPAGRRQVAGAPWDAGSGLALLEDHDSVRALPEDQARGPLEQLQVDEQLVGGAVGLHPDAVDPRGAGLLCAASQGHRGALAFLQAVE